YRGWWGGGDKPVAARRKGTSADRNAAQDEPPPRHGAYRFISLPVDRPRWTGPRDAKRPWLVSSETPRVPGRWAFRLPWSAPGSSVPASSSAVPPARSDSPGSHLSHP